MRVWRTALRAAIASAGSDAPGWKLLDSSALAARLALDTEPRIPNFSRRRCRAQHRVHGPSRRSTLNTQEIYMKRLALVAAVVLVAACSTQEKPADTAAPAMAPAPAMSADTSMAHDSAMAAMDTTKKDSTAKADTTKKP